MKTQTPVEWAVTATTSISSWRHRLEVLVPCGRLSCLCDLASPAWSEEAGAAAPDVGGMPGQRPRKALHPWPYEAGLWLCSAGVGAELVPRGWRFVAVVFFTSFVFIFIAFVRSCKYSTCLIYESQQLLDLSKKKKFVSTYILCVIGIEFGTHG